ncbi:hypothetical protein KQX54_005579 [Cotesia glomerata]|uniref:Uncharacterized protein n=1 Tax=Cotesia glomerata TaxID=32391 RepID=A0AAV7I3X4_COTGL|nr:hypothetical protein KQX54_005579 [Cotesia glomerata]
MDIENELRRRALLSEGKRQNTPPSLLHNIRGDKSSTGRYGLSLTLTHDLDLNLDLDLLVQAGSMSSIKSIEMLTAEGHCLLQFAVVAASVELTATDRHEELRIAGLLHDILHQLLNYDNNSPDNNWSFDL